METLLRRIYAGRKYPTYIPKHQYKKESKYGSTVII